ncbi:MAG: response regulator, partial [Cytophagales bacterium]
MSVPKKVLIAEDSSVIQNLTKKILQQQDYDIKSVKNGQELLKIIETENFDVILLDINMPIVNRIECAKAIRAM